jgi:hypothetical protein
MSELVRKMTVYLETWISSGGDELAKEKAKEIFDVLEPQEVGVLKQVFGTQF